MIRYIIRRIRERRIQPRHMTNPWLIHSQVGEQRLRRVRVLVSAKMNFIITVHIISNVIRPDAREFNILIIILQGLRIKLTVQIPLPTAVIPEFAGVGNRIIIDAITACTRVPSLAQHVSHGFTILGITNALPQTSVRPVSLWPDSLIP